MNLRMRTENLQVLRQGTGPAALLLVYWLAAMLLGLSDAQTTGNTTTASLATTVKPAEQQSPSSSLADGSVPAAAAGAAIAAVVVGIAFIFIYRACYVNRKGRVVGAGMEAPAGEAFAQNPFSQLQTPASQPIVQGTVQITPQPRAPSLVDLSEDPRGEIRPASRTRSSDTADDYSSMDDSIAARVLLAPRPGSREQQSQGSEYNSANNSLGSWHKGIPGSSPNSLGPPSRTRSEASEGLPCIAALILPFLFLSRAPGHVPPVPSDAEEPVHSGAVHHGEGARCDAVSTGIFAGHSARDAVSAPGPPRRRADRAPRPEDREHPHDGQPGHGDPVLPALRLRNRPGRLGLHRHRRHPPLHVPGRPQEEGLRPAQGGRLELWPRRDGNVHGPEALRRHLLGRRHHCGPPVLERADRQTAGLPPQPGRRLPLPVPRRSPLLRPRRGPPGGRGEGRQRGHQPEPPRGEPLPLPHD